MIPVCSPVHFGSERRNVEDCFNTNSLTSGKYIGMLENMFCDYLKTKFACACSSGTAALHLALVALGIKPGDEVIVPAFGMIATTNAILYCGATPVLVDSDLETWNINPKLIEEQITPKTKAIIVTHIYGNPCDMKEIMKIANKHNIPIVEDAAEALGSSIEGKMCGSFGKISCFSTYSNKICHSCEGGIVVSDDENLINECKKLRNHYFGEPRFVHEKIGFNYRLSNIHAAIGCAQMEQVGYLVERRIKNANLYMDKLNINDFMFPKVLPGHINSFWMFAIQVNRTVYGVTKETLMYLLNEDGIETRSFFCPAHLQPAYKDLIKGEFNPVSEILWRNGLYLPSSGSLTIKDIEFIAEKIKSHKSYNNQKRQGLY